MSSPKKDGGIIPPGRKQASELEPNPKFNKAVNVYVKQVNQPKEELEDPDIVNTVEPRKVGLKFENMKKSVEKIRILKQAINKIEQTTSKNIQKKVTILTKDTSDDQKNSRKDSRKNSDPKDQNSFSNIMDFGSENNNKLSLNKSKSIFDSGLAASLLVGKGLMEKYTSHSEKNKNIA